MTLPLAAHAHDPGSGTAPGAFAVPPGRAATADAIVLRGARQNNLKNLTLRIPRHRLVVVTGPSGSGKSSLAFDTLYAEGQRRYLESLSAYARQFLEQVPKPDVDRVEGLSPALAIEQRGLQGNPRSTVGTVTEILPFLRLLYARLGEPSCPRCGVAMRTSHPANILEDLQSLAPGTKLTLLAPVVRGRRGEQRKLLTDLRRRGLLRVRVDGQLQELGALEALEKGARHDLDVVVDRLVSGNASMQRLQASVELSLALGEGRMLVQADSGEERLYSEKLACPACGEGSPALEPRLFSFNSPAGACPHCRGLGSRRRVGDALLIPDPSLSLRAGALAPLRGRAQSFTWQQVEHLVAALGGSLDVPVTDLSPTLARALLDGTQGAEFAALRLAARGHERFLTDFEGLRAMIERRAEATSSPSIRAWCESFMEQQACAACRGMRLRPEALAVRLHGLDLGTLCALPLCALAARGRELRFDGAAARIAAPLLAEILTRVEFLVEAGLGYLSLDRAADSLSGGEGQRVRLATQLGSRLTGVLYVLDEPSVGLHARDTGRLIGLLQRLRDRGNTVVVVEHDRDIIEAADHVLDLGPGAGEHGGYLVAQGTPAQIVASAASPTGQWLARRPSAGRGAHRTPHGPRLVVRGITARNLKDIDLEIPLGCLVAVTGVSGSGKSTAIHDVLHRALARLYHRAAAEPGPHRGIEGTAHLSKVVLIDQHAIGRSSRSTPATFTGVYLHLRKLLASTPSAKARGFTPGRFSFNTEGGRCEACRGAGVRVLAMDFLPEVHVRCDACKGRRFNQQTLEVTWKGRSIADLLEHNVEEAKQVLVNVPPIRRILETMEAVGLGYLALGQPADTLSGGEAQRIKLARELSRPAGADTLYLLDEPTTGLHFQDVDLLLTVLQRLVDKGSTVLVIEHHPDMIAAADHVIDLGPEGGADGGEIVVAGPVSAVVECPRSHTGAMLRRTFAGTALRPAGPGL
jgi:excinuclease ABC subunit A